jgi:hypothetical protein
VSEPTTPSGRAMYSDYMSGELLLNRVPPIGTVAEQVARVEAEARALLLDELEAAVRELPEYGVLLNDYDSMHTGVVERERVLALIQQHREAIR